jgi:hypothetical protein
MVCVYTLDASEKDLIMTTPAMPFASPFAIPFALQRPDFDAITAGGMVLLVLVMTIAWLRVIYLRNTRKALWAVLVLLVIVLANVAGDLSGVFSRLDVLPPPFALLVLANVGLAFMVGMGWLGSMGDTLVRTMSVESLVALQIFRLPLEILMLRAAYLGIIPMEFSMQGYNLDMLTGLGALLIYAYCIWTLGLPLRAIGLWNALGIGCLLVIAVLAALTSPNVHAFGLGARHINSWVLYFPYSMLPTLLVTYAVFGHVLLTRKLLAQKYLVSGKPSQARRASDSW